MKKNDAFIQRLRELRNEIINITAPKGITGVSDIFDAFIADNTQTFDDIVNELADSKTDDIIDTAKAEVKLRLESIIEELL